MKHVHRRSFYTPTSYLAIHTVTNIAHTLKYFNLVYHLWEQGIENIMFLYSFCTHLRTPNEISMLSYIVTIFSTYYWTRLRCTWSSKIRGRLLLIFQALPRTASKSSRPESTLKCLNKKRNILWNVWYFTRWEFVSNHSATKKSHHPRSRQGKWATTRPSKTRPPKKVTNHSTVKECDQTLGR